MLHDLEEHVLEVGAADLEVLDPHARGAQRAEHRLDLGRVVRGGLDDAAGDARLGLPVTEAYASPMCRTMEHAHLMLGDVTARPEVREAQGGDYDGLKQLLAAPVAAGGNRWIVGHGIPFRAVAGPPHLAEGEAVVIRPDATGWTVVARLQVSDWQALAAGAR